MSVFTEIALVIHSVFSVYLWRKSQLIITEPNSWDSLITKSQITMVLEHRHGNFSSQFCGHGRVYPCGPQATCIRITHWQLVKMAGSCLPWKCPKSTSPRKVGRHRNLHFSRSFPLLKAENHRVIIWNIKLLGYSNLLLSLTLWFRRQV